MWSREDIRIALDPDATDFPVVGVEIETPMGILRIIGEVVETGRRIVVEEAHIESATPAGASFDPAGLGLRNLIAIARAFLEEVDADEIIVRGGVRTTGRGKGRRPQPFRYARGRGGGARG